jgi:hypothetical protein
MVLRAGRLRRAGPLGVGIIVIGARFLAAPQAAAAAYGIASDWHPVTRTSRDGRTEAWHAADAAPDWWGPGRDHPPGGSHRRPGHPAG